MDAPPRLGPLFLGMAMVTMADTILTIAIPSITAELSGARGYTALVTAYLLPQALATPVGGRLVDLYRPRLVVAVACLLYLLATFGAGQSHSMNELLCFRVLQGLAGGALQASIYGLLDLLVPPAEQGRVQATAGMILGGGAAVAPLVGGILTDRLGWRWCFFANLPLGLICLLYLRKLPNLQPRGKGKLDFPGVGLLSGATISLMFAFTLGGTHLPWSDPLVLSLLVTALFVAAVFWKVERTRPEPLFDPSLVNRGVFGWAALAYFCMGGAFLSSLLYIPLELQVVRGLSPLMAGVALVPFIVGNIVGAVVQGGLVKEYGRYRPFALLGTSTTFVIFALMVWGLTVPIASMWPLWVWAILLGGLGFTFGVGWDMYTLAVQNDTIASRQGMAGSMMDFIRQMGGALGIALAGTFLIASLDARLPREIQAHLQPLGLDMDVSRFTYPDELSHISVELRQALRTDIERSYAGDKAALQRVLASSLLPADLRADLQKGVQRQDVEGQLEAVAVQADKGLQMAVISALRKAQRDVFAMEALLCLVALFAASRLPDRELLEELRE